MLSENEALRAKVDSLNSLVTSFGQKETDLTNKVHSLKSLLSSSQQQETELKDKVKRMESRLRCVPQEIPKQNAHATQSASVMSMLEGGYSGGGVGQIVVDVLKDIELGEKSEVTLTDLGLSELTSLKPVDKFLQLTSALMTVRADARFLVFGLWSLCHCLYVLYLIYAHLI
mmetsp:Transcript_8347/g.18086  ORF Transcript_8347/g.18086 Transcript_8347/m.18086 type:complete len:172 (-) Transcript_8347:58-573(-)